MFVHHIIHCVHVWSQEAVVVKLRLKNTALKVQKRKLLLQLRQVCSVLYCHVRMNYVSNCVLGLCLVGSCWLLQTEYFTSQIYIIIDSLFIFSVSKLLLDAASYDGEIWHADAWRPCPGLLLVFISIGVVVTKKWHFPQMRPHRHRRFAAVSHCRQRVGPVRPTQTGRRPWSGGRTVRRPVCRSLMQVADLSGRALRCLPKTT